jgi:hypothetical protein
MTNVADTQPQPPARSGGYQLSPQQLNYLATFGYLRIPGLFADDIGWITDGFERVFANHETWDLEEWLHFDRKRSIVPQFIDRDDELVKLRDDPRVVDIATAVLGEDYEYAESDASLFYCDTSWHPDIYGAPIDQFHLKLSFYLDPLVGDKGAIRMIPGTNHLGTTYAKLLYGKLQKPDEIGDTFGVDYDQIPSVVVESRPGDLLMWNYRTVHASFGGDDRRRLFSVSFKQPRHDDDA